MSGIVDSILDNTININQAYIPEVNAINIACMSCKYIK